MIVWRALDDNPCMNHARQVVADYLPALEKGAETCGPGPFSMADEVLVRRQLQSAGYEAVEFQRVDAEVNMGDTLDDAIEFHLAIGPAGEIYREAGEIAVERHADIVAALKRELAPFETPQGIIMPSSSWKITARNA